MANPGEVFPQQFALGILQLNSVLTQKKAELSEMRADRMSRQFLEEERLASSERMGGVQAQAQIASNQISAEAHKEESAARLQFEMKRFEEQQANADNANLAKIGKTDFFVRHGGPSPPPDALTGPTVKNEQGQDVPAYQYLVHELPGVGTYYHKSEDQGLIQQFRENEVKMKDQIGQDLLRRSQASYYDARAKEYDEGKGGAAGGRLDVQRTNGFRVEYQKYLQNAAAAANELSLLNPTPTASVARRIAALRSNPAALFDPDPTDDPETTERKAGRVKYIRQLEVNLENAANPDFTPPRMHSITGTHPLDQKAAQDMHELIAQMDPSNPVRRAEETGTGNISVHKLLRQTGPGTYEAVDAKGPGTFPGQVRSYYDKTGAEIGKDYLSHFGRVLGAEGKSPYAMSPPPEGPALSTNERAAAHPAPAGGTPDSSKIRELLLEIGARPDRAATQEEAAMVEEVTGYKIKVRK